jgi:hypothetical protein
MDLVFVNFSTRNAVFEDSGFAVVFRRMLAPALLAGLRAEVHVMESDFLYPDLFRIFIVPLGTKDRFNEGQRYFSRRFPAITLALFERYREETGGAEEFVHYFIEDARTGSLEAKEAVRGQQLREAFEHFRRVFPFA